MIGRRGGEVVTVCLRSLNIHTEKCGPQREIKPEFQWSGILLYYDEMQCITYVVLTCAGAVQHMPLVFKRFLWLRSHRNTWPANILVPYSNNNNNNSAERSQNLCPRAYGRNFNCVIFYSLILYDPTRYCYMYLRQPIINQFLPTFSKIYASSSSSTADSSLSQFILVNVGSEIGYEF
jgi:hypothetical protein